MIKLGIPRALLYYHYHSMWKTFFEELGADVIISPSTTQDMVSAGSALVVSDTCLPVKVYMGHVLSLVETCDLIFIPVIRRLKGKPYNCPKLIGLAAVARSVIRKRPPILEVDVDLYSGKKELQRVISAAAQPFTRDRRSIEQAAIKAWLSYIKSARNGYPAHNGRPGNGGSFRPDAVHQGKSEIPGLEQCTIAVIGHPYVFSDEFISHHLIYRLEKYKCRVITPNMLSRNKLYPALTRVMGGAYWLYEEEVVGAGEYFLENGGIDGIISITAFNCGPDSLMVDVVRRRAQGRNMPFLNLTVEEHTADIGMITRLEAFLDMILRRKRKNRCAWA